MGEEGKIFLSEVGLWRVDSVLAVEQGWIVGKDPMFGGEVKA